MVAVTLPWPGAVLLGVGVGVTTGNSEFRLLGLTVGPGMTSGYGGGSVIVTTGAGDDDGLEDELFVPIVPVIDASAGESPAPSTVTPSVTCSPAVAFAPILSVTTSSIACSADSSPIEHRWPWLAGHNVKLGGPEDAPELDTVAVTEVAGVVLQVQIEYVISPPGHAFDWPRSICPVTQMTPGFWDGVGLGELDPELVGVLVVLWFWLGVGDPVLCDGLGDDDWSLGLGVEVVVSPWRSDGPRV